MEAREDDSRKSNRDGTVLVSHFYHPIAIISIGAHGVLVATYHINIDWTMGEIDPGLFTALKLAESVKLSQVVHC